MYYEKPCIYAYRADIILFFQVVDLYAEIFDTDRKLESHNRAVQERLEKISRSVTVMLAIRRSRIKVRPCS